jgi:hypothetical protein
VRKRAPFQVAETSEEEKTSEFGLASLQIKAKTGNKSNMMRKKLPDRLLERI